MKRSIVLLLAVAVLAGCRQDGQWSNPFAPWGAVRVPPPATGAVRPNAPPYYQPPAGTPGAAATQSPSPTAAQPPAQPATRTPAKSPAGSSTRSPLGNYVGRQAAPTGRHGSMWSSPAGRRYSAPADVSLTSGVAVPVTPNASVVGTGMYVNDATTGGQPRRFVPPPNAVSLSAPPIANHSAAVSVATAPTRAAARFGYQEDYKWLRGRLEYSQAGHRWKLRYIPYDVPEGKIDQHGGSVVLADGSLLAGYKPGDFITVWGSLGKKEPGAIDFAPVYHPQRIERVD